MRSLAVKYSLSSNVALNKAISNSEQLTLYIIQSEMGEKQSKSLRDELTLDPKDWVPTKY